MRTEPDQPEAVSLRKKRNNICTTEAARPFSLLSAVRESICDVTLTSQLVGKQDIKQSGERERSEKVREAEKGTSGNEMR